MKNPINKEVFDTRDLIEYYDEIKVALLDEYNLAIEEYYEEESVVDNLEDAIQEILQDIDDWEEYDDLTIFIDELKDYCPDFEYGTTVIHEDYFQEYCEELLVDCGYIPKDLPTWIEIDMEATSENMKQDYTEFEYDRETYFAR